MTTPLTPPPEAAAKHTPPCHCITYGRDAHIDRDCKEHGEATWDWRKFLEMSGRDLPSPVRA